VSFPRFLAAGVVVSLVLHGTGSAFFAGDPNEVLIAASQGGGVSVIGSIEDLVAGAQVEQVEVTPPTEEVEPVVEPLEPVAAPVEVARAVEETPVKAVEVTPMQPVAEPLMADVTADPATVVPVVEGVTRAEPVKAVRPAEVMPPEEQPQTAASPDASPAPVDAVKPVETARVAPLPDQKPVEMASVSPTETPAPVEPVKPEVEMLEAVPDPLQEVTETPRTKPEPPVRKSEPRKVPEETRTVQKKGAEASTRKGGERITSETARSNANGRADARTEDGGTKATSNYKGKVAAKLRRAKRYPREARRQRLDATVVVAFTIASNGSVSGIRVTRSSGHQVLDQAALDMVRRASPMPNFPRDMRLARLNIEVPMRFTPN